MSEKITFKELVEQIAKQSKQSQSSTNNFIHELVQIIESGLKDSGSVSISGFGKFELRWMNPRQSQHPKTGEQITVPGQNKVVFKPYKNLREGVNLPFAGLTSRVVKNADKEYSETEEKKSSTEEKKSAQKTAAFASVASTSDSAEDLLIEHDNPKFKGTPQTDSPTEKSQETVSENNDDLLAKEENPANLKTDSTPEDEKTLFSPPEEKKLASEVQEAGSFNWGYAAAVIIAIIVFIILFFMYQRYQGSSDSPSQAAFNNQNESAQTESMPSTSADESVESSESGQPETPPPNAGTEISAQDSSSPGATQTEFETTDFTVESGQSLWSIAESQLGNPYLWPVLYHLNRDQLDNPNSIPADGDITIPSISDPENLNEFEREQVALGYFDLYEWNAEYNPDEARFFLWAVGVFSPDLLDQPPSDVNSEDLEFARNR